MTTYTQNCPTTMTTDTSGSFNRLPIWAHRYLQQQSLKRAIAKERSQLAKLSPELLQDIGVDQISAIQEAKRTSIPARRAV